MDCTALRGLGRLEDEEHTPGCAKYSRSTSHAAHDPRCGIARFFVFFALACSALVACKKDVPPVPLSAATAARGQLRVLDGPGDAEGDTGWWPNVQFDRRGSPHVAFCDAHHGDVRYATETAGAWSVKSIFSQGAVGKYIAMDIDANDRVGLMFYDQDKRYLHFARQDKPDGAWQDERVAWGRELGIGGAMRFDVSGVPHVFYYLPSGNLIHATPVKGQDEWDKKTVAQVQGVYSMRTSAATRPDGVWLSYVNWTMKDAVMYLGHMGETGWEATTVNNEKGPGWRSQLVYIDGRPQVVHSGHLTVETQLSAQAADGNWVTRPMIATGSSFAAATWKNRLVVAFQDASDLKAGKAVRYTIERESGPWPVYTVDDSAPVGGYIAASVSQSGRLLIAYYADAERALKLYDEQLAD
jgi:hypothetical protein